MIRHLTELSLDAFLDAASNVPCQQIELDLFPGIDVWIRRDDLIDPIISGNKAYKLIYNLLEANKQGKNTIVTCGGAWSNHIHATAAAGQRFGFKTVGIIRGGRPPVLSATLQDAERFGMKLCFVSRLEYKGRNKMGFLERVGLSGERYWYVPEGGANIQGAKGVQILGRSIADSFPQALDECWLACGTGLSLGALAPVLSSSMRVVGVPVLKAEESIRKEAVQWAERLGRAASFELVEGAHHGGYGKLSESLLAFQHALEARVNTPLDQVYTSKIAHALMKYAYAVSQKGCRRPKSILLIHTGGLQGRRGIVIKRTN